MAQDFKDLVVVLPGITGSVLERDGKQVWGFSAAAVWNTLTSRGRSLQELELTGDDPRAVDIGDGVTATRLIHRAHSLPGLHKNVGYGPLVDALSTKLGLTVGYGEGSQAGNLFELPYDWRRDNRAAAYRLAELVATHLPRWRAASGADDAKVVLVAHSMGGMVSRYYLEALEGWRNCRALVTFGTPFRGAPNSLNFLANGYKNMLLDLTEVMRSYTSIYQLLPRYECIDLGDRLVRPSELEGVAGLDTQRAVAGREFHLEIDRAIEAHREMPGYLVEPIAGMGQPTLQSASVVDGVLTCSMDVPRGWDAVHGDGDGTVPRVSATPIELSDDHRETFIPQRHSALQVGPRTIDQVVRKLQQMQGCSIGVIRGPGSGPPAAPHLSVDLDDAYAAGEPVEIRGTAVNHVDSSPTITVTIGPSRGDGPDQQHVARWQGGRFSVEVEGLSPGCYDVTVSSVDLLGNPAPAVQDIVDVVAS